MNMEEACEAAKSRDRRRKMVALGRDWKERSELL